ncbi:MAG: CPBP family intramembrane metalloprotease [Ruminococcaceae bacterium]|nr:CPBP family intramembrane metalloprotease [Oscillospiraceae bacterium]
MKRLYQKSEISFALVWIGLYVVVMNIALQFCGGFDDLADKTVPQMLIPVICILILAIASTVWILRNGLTEKFGLCKFKGNAQTFLWFLPLVIMSCINLKNGLTLSASLVVSALMAINLAVGGYVEELIFRGFLFRAMAKDNLRSAIIVSAVTFGAGHIVNVFNTSDIFGVLLQVGYAIVIGFLYTVIVYKGGSLWPCIASHIFVNGSSVFARDEGPFTQLVAAVFGQATPSITEACSAALIIIISGGYALWLWKKTK